MSIMEQPLDLTHIVDTEVRLWLPAGSGGPHLPRPLGAVLSGHSPARLPPWPAPSPCTLGPGNLRKARPTGLSSPQTPGLSSDLCICR